MSLPAADHEEPSQLTEWQAQLEAARNGNDVALGQICQQFYKHLLLTADDGLGGDLRAKLGASDVVQQSMLEVQNDFVHFAGESEQEFRRWITRLVERNLIDASRQFRQTQRRDISRERPIDLSTGAQDSARLPLPAREGTASRIVSRREEDQILADAVKRLPIRQRLVVELRHRQGHSYSEIANQLDTTESVARKIWSRAVEKLRHDLACTEKRQLVDIHEQHSRQPR